MMVKTKKIIEIDEALDKAIKEKIMTKKQSTEIIEYLGAGGDGDYRKLYWTDVEEENGMENSEIFKKFYKMLKKYEDIDHLLFDFTLYA